MSDIPGSSRATPASADSVGSTGFLIFAALFLGMGSGVLLALLRLAKLAWRQLRQPVLHNDSWYFTDLDGKSSLEWLFSQHNEHRLVLSKLTTLVESNILGIPPFSTALLQTFLLLLLSLGILALICRQVVAGRRARWLTWLSTSLLLLNPWQWEALAWEFQTSWFFINLLVLLSAYLLLNLNRQGLRPCLIAALAILPWLAIFNNGSGFGLVAAIAVATLWLTRRELITATTSILICCLAYFPLLAYRRPWAEARMGFDIDFFARLVLGGKWQGLSIIVVVLSLVLLLVLDSESPQRRLPRMGRRTDQGINQRTVAALSLPALFAIFFSATTTLARSQVQAQYSDYSYYVVHTLMLPVSLVLLWGFVFSRPGFIASASRASLSTHRFTFLIPSFLVVVTTFFSFPQVLTRNAPGYWESWSLMVNHRLKAQQLLECFARSAATDPDGAIPSRAQCPGGSSEGDRQMIDRYLRGQNTVKPLGWHRDLTQRRS